MYRNTITLLFRKIGREKTYSIINIVGLSVALAISLNILLFFIFHHSFDKYNEDYRSIYRIYSKSSDPRITSHQGLNLVPDILASEIKLTQPEVLFSSRVSPMKSTLLKGDELITDVKTYIADPDFFSIFTVRLIAGDPKIALASPNSLVITEKIARIYFGRTNVVGEPIRVQGDEPQSVGAVIADLPKNSHLSFDMVVLYSMRTSGWLYNNATTYIKLKNGSDSKRIEKNITDLVKKNRSSDKPDQYILQPVSGIHLNGNLDFELHSNYNKKYLDTITLIGMLILLMAIFNYVNISVARAHQRSPEIGVRKTVGANRTELFKQFFFESFIITSVSLVIAMILGEFLSGFIGRILFQTNEIASKNWIYYLSVFLIWVLSIFLSGLYPALVLSSFRPIKVLQKSRRGSFRKINLRRVIIGLQLTTTSILITVSLFFFLQMNYIKNRDLGFSKENIISYTRYKATVKNYPVIRDELLKMTAVQDVTSSTYIPSSINRKDAKIEFPQKPELQKIDINRNKVDLNFFGFYSIRIVSGRSFSAEYATDAENAIVVNEEFITQYAVDYPKESRVIVDGTEKVICGVCQNFHFAALHEPIRPLILQPSNELSDFYAVSIKLKNASDANLLAINSVVKRLSEKLPVQYQFMEDQISSSYASERNNMHRILFLTLIAVLISVLGLLSLATYSAAQRKAEVAIRKVYGASPGDLRFLLNTEYMIIVLISNLIALPIGIFIVSKWLQNFAYHIPIYPLVFIGVLAINSLIAVGTILFQVQKTIAISPARVLSNE